MTENEFFYSLVMHKRSFRRVSYDFDWIGGAGEESRNEITSLIRDDLERRATFKGCHDGSVKVLLSFTDPFNEMITGEIKCSCGKIIGTVAGKSSGSLSYAAV